MLDRFRFEYVLLPAPEGVLRMQRRAIVREEASDS